MEKLKLEEEDDDEEEEVGDGDTRLTVVVDEQEVRGASTVDFEVKVNPILGDGIELTMMGGGNAGAAAEEEKGAEGGAAKVDAVSGSHTWSTATPARRSSIGVVRAAASVDASRGSLDDLALVKK